MSFLYRAPSGKILIVTFWLKTLLDNKVIEFFGQQFLLRESVDQTLFWDTTQTDIKET